MYPVFIHNKKYLCIKLYIYIHNIHYRLNVLKVYSKCLSYLIDNIAFLLNLLFKLQSLSGYVG